MYKVSDIGVKLRLLREYRKIKSMRKAATILGKHHQQWYLWESGQVYPAATQIVDICNTFKISLEYFYKDGLPENFDFSDKQVQSDPIPFTRTTVSQDIARIIEEAKKEKYLTLVIVLSGAGSSRAIREYAALEEHVLIFDGKYKIEKTPRSGLDVAILDHAEHQQTNEIQAFINSVRKLSSGVVIISHNPCDALLFDKQYRLKYLCIEDLKNILRNAIGEMDELLAAHHHMDLKDQLLSVLASEVIEDIKKIKRLREKFLEDVIPVFSLENMLLKLSRL